MTATSKLCFAALALSAGAFGQTKAWTAPRLEDGKPDQNGIWEVRAKIDANLEGKIGGKNIILDPPNGRIPYKPEALAQRNRNALNKAQGDSMNQCYMPGVPRLAWIPYPFQIVQSAGQPLIVFLSQYVHTLRNLHLRGEHLDGLELWLGDTRAHWDGDTLVAEAMNFNDQTWLDAAGNFHSTDMKVVERFTRTGPETIRYEATIEDPKVLTKPFKVA